MRESVRTTQHEKIGRQMKPCLVFIRSYCFIILASDNILDLENYILFCMYVSESLAYLTYLVFTLLGAIPRIEC